MSLVPCRACDHQVDTSALACPNCGATDPGHPISRQQRNFRLMIVQVVIGLALVIGGGAWVWNAAIPAVKQMLNKPAPG